MKDLYDEITNPTWVGPCLTGEDDDTIDDVVNRVDNMIKSYFELDAIQELPTVIAVHHFLPAHEPDVPASWWSKIRDFIGQ